MQKVLVGLCTLFLLTVIFYKYSKDKLQEGKKDWDWTHGNYRRTDCTDCTTECTARFPNFGNRQQKLISRVAKPKCLAKCDDECVGNTCVGKPKDRCRRLKACKWTGEKWWHLHNKACKSK